MNRIYTINIIVFILYSIGAIFDSTTADVLAALLTIISLMLVCGGIWKTKQNSCEKKTLSSYIHALIFCLCSLLYAGVIFLSLK